MGYGRGGVEITGGEVSSTGATSLKAGSRACASCAAGSVLRAPVAPRPRFNPAHRLMDQVIEAALEHGVAKRRGRDARSRTFRETWACPIRNASAALSPPGLRRPVAARMTAMALCPEPDLIVFDEPTTALDVTTQIDVLAAIKEAIRETGVAALYITHDLAVVAQVVRRHHGAAQRPDSGSWRDCADHPRTARGLHAGAGLGPIHRTSGKKARAQAAAQRRWRDCSLWRPRRRGGSQERLAPAVTPDRRWPWWGNPGLENRRSPA